MKTSWPRIFVLWMVGVLAAAQLAKISVIAPLLQAAYGLSLPEIALLISLLEVGGGLFGFLAGLGLARAGARRFLLSGGVVLSGACCVEAIAPTLSILFAARAMEGVGYMLMVVAAPTAIAAAATDRDRGRALVLWSTFVPVGLAIGSAITASAVAWAGARGVMLLWALVMISITAALVRLPVAEIRGSAIRLPSPAAWISTFGFGLYTMFICGLTMLLPSFLIEQGGAAIRDAGLIAAIASLAALPGSGLALRIMKGGRLGGRQMVLLSTAALLATIPLVCWLYRNAQASLLESGAFAITAALVSGLVPPLLFARLPSQAGAATPDDPRIAAANGLLTQFGAGGALVGPPLAGAIVAAWGWPALGFALGSLVIAMLGSIVAAEWFDARPTTASA